MLLSTSATNEEEILAAISGLMAFEAPYLTEKLLKERMVRSPAEAAGLFAELKKYLVLAHVHRGVHVPMFSRRVDEVWHQFVLFTPEYRAFGRRFFGRYVHHAPDLDGRSSGDEARASDRGRMTFPQFRVAYMALFGDLSPLWNDERAVTDVTRLLRSNVRGSLDVRIEAGKADLIWSHGDGERVLVRIPEWANAALRFLVAYDVFYVRELPALRDEAERVAVCRPLVRSRFLWVAP